MISSVNELLCISADQLEQYGMLFVKSKEPNGSSWHYILLEEAKLPIFMGLSKLFPLKVNLTDYGKIIKSGEGEAPPQNVKNQMNNADFSEQAPKHESEIFYLECHDENHKHFYIYLDVPYYLRKKFVEIKDSRQEFESTDFGEILYSDWGHPTAEVKAKMKEKYGIDTPTAKTVKESA